MVEDVVTTGLSSREAMACVAAAGGEVIAEAALVDRSAGSVELGVPFYPLVAINFPTYAADELPEALAGPEAIKPGSRRTEENTPEHPSLMRNSHDDYSL